MGIDQLFTAILAGLLTVLNPCVLPLLPIVFAAAISKHPVAGPLALAAGLTTSFITAALAFTLIYQSINAEPIRPVGGAILVAIGLLLLVPAFQRRLQTAAGPAVNWISGRFGGVGEGPGWLGQFGLGFVLGLVWSPCAGPTIGVASSLAFYGDDYFALVVILLAFGVGAAIPLVVLGFLSRTILMRWRDRLARFAAVGRFFLGALLVTVGILIVTGVDRQLEAYLNRVLPQGLLDLTVRF